MDKLNRQTSILSYWTIRYLIIISIGLLLTALATFWWIRQEAMDNRMQTTGLLAQEIADRSLGPDGSIEISRNLNTLIEDRKRFFKLTLEMCVIITDNEGKLLFSMPPLSQEEMEHKLNDEMNDVRSPEYKAATAAIHAEGTTLGQVFVLQSKRTLTHIPQEEIRFFAIMLLFLIILSWLTIYLLSRKLARPILRVATAASQISSGQYNITLKADAKEREINELILSFQDMAGRLKQLEHSRAIMLAGVSHELKTPVTSIKGLVHAVREKVVEGGEADEFLDIALIEAGKLQRMVADLLDYNALAAGMVSVRHDKLLAVPLLTEIIYQWKLTQGDDVSEPVLILPSTPVFLRGDPLRIQQIIVNLLNNSLQAKRDGVPLQLTVELVVTGPGQAEIIVTDNGTGIVPEHRELVFEAYFRGGYKESTLRGLGLGLTFSTLLAEAMGGSLALRTEEDTQNGATFVLTLPLER
jgi:two-component system, sensor histidine kinase